MNPGDVPYPQYSVVTTQQIQQSQAIVKGRLYTSIASTNPTGLGVITAIGTTLVNGFFQATVDVTVAPSTDDESSVQVLGPRTRMIFTTQTAGLFVGQDVIYVNATKNVIAGTKSSDLYVGKIFEIYTRNTDSSKKTVTEIGDKVVVETVQA